jgi:hypothetical protein
LVAALGFFVSLDSFEVFVLTARFFLIGFSVVDPFSAVTSAGAREVTLLGKEMRHVS